MDGWVEEKAIKGKPLFQREELVQMRKGKKDSRLERNLLQASERRGSD